MQHLFSRGAIAAVMVGGLAGCTETMWVRPGGTAQAFNADRYQCEQQSLISAPINRQVTSVSKTRDRRGRPETYVSTSDVNSSARERLYRSCLQAAGWREVPVNQPQPVTASRPAQAPVPVQTPVAGANPGGSLCRQGVRVYALSDGAWFAGTVLSARPDGCHVTFEGFGSDEDDVVTEREIMPWAAQGPGEPVDRCQRGDRVVGYAPSEKAWYPATVKETRTSGRCPVHYIDWDDRHDESLPLNRLRRL